MLVHVDTAKNRSDVRDVDDLKRFAVVVAGDGTDDAIEQALAPLARLDPPGHAWVSIDRLRTACGRDDDPDWSSAFNGMVQYAGSKGWLDETGTELRAHIERIPGGS